jgi:predicted Zn-dependent peptidase
MNIAIVGDVNPAEARRMAEKYFAPMAARPMPPVVRTQEPPQAGPKQVAVESASQPFLFVGYKRPDQYDPSDPVFAVIQLILHSGHTGWMYKEMVQERKIALSVVAAGTIPGGRYSNLFVFYAVPSSGHSVDENEKAIDDIVQRLKNQRVDAETLDRAKTQARGEAIRRLSNNPDLAKLLTSFYGSYGDWRKLFTGIDDLNKVTADDVQRAARRYFVTTSRTTAYAAQPSQPGPRPPAGVTRR